MTKFKSAQKEATPDKKKRKKRKDVDETIRVKKETRDQRKPVTVLKTRRIGDFDANERVKEEGEGIGLALKSSRSRESTVAPLRREKRVKKNKHLVLVDRRVPNRDHWRVHRSCSTLLNMTNIEGNNNKYLIVQLLQNHVPFKNAHFPPAVETGSFRMFSRWGRVGEDGALAFRNYAYDRKHAEAAFEAIYLQKTGNHWSAVQADKHCFAKQPGRYQVVDVDTSGYPAEDPASVSLSAAGIAKSAKFGAGSSVGICTGTGSHKQVLGKLSAAQIKKGQAVLDKLGIEIRGKNCIEVLIQLSSDFYSLIPTR